MRSLVTLFVFGLAFAVNSPAQAADGVTVGGYVDTSIGYTTFEDPGESRMGVSVNQAGISFSHEMGVARGHVEKGLATGSPDQYYVTRSYDGGLSWKLGFFDVVYGLEDNRNVENSFATPSGFNYLEFDHTGLHINYDVSDMIGVGLLVDKDIDTPGPSATEDMSPGLGFQANVDMGPIQLQGTYRMNDDMTALAQGGKTLINVSARMEMGGLRIGAEFQTASDDVAAESPLDIQAEVLYGMSDTMDFGGRYRMSSNVGGVADRANSMITIGMMKWVTEHFRTALEANLTSYDPVKPKAETMNISVNGTYRL